MHAEAYQGTLGQLTAEPVPVKISYERCDTHGFFKINVPRDSDDRNPETFKCPLRDCSS